MANNVESHSFNAFGVQYYDERCSKEILYALEPNVKPKKSIPAFDVVVVDECQDLSPTLFDFVCKVLQDIVTYNGGKRPLLLLLGDNHQTVYAYKGADCRYLTHADRIPRLGNASPWTRLRLSTSYRITGNMARFVNDVLLNVPSFITAHKPAGLPVRYLVGDTFEISRKIAAEIIQRVRGGDAPGDFFVLCPSVKCNAGSKDPPVRVLENMLAQAQVALFRPVNDDFDSAECVDDLVKGRVFITTFHQCKGLERLYVYAFGFNAEYFDYCGRDFLRQVCPNTLYVAATRAMKELTIVAEKEPGKHLPFLQRKRLDSLDLEKNPCVKIITVGHWVNRLAEETEESNVVLATQLTYQLREDVPFNALRMLRWKTIQAQQAELSIPCKLTDSSGKPFSVAAINALALPAILETRATGKCAMYTALRRQAQSVDVVGKIPMNPVVRKLSLALPPPKEHEGASGFLKLAMLYRTGVGDGTVGFINEFLMLTRERPKFDWIDQKHMQEGLDRLCKAIPDYGQGKYATWVYTQLPFTCVTNPGEFQVLNPVIRGRVDILTPSTLWGIKCVDDVSNEHKIQQAIYAWQWERSPERMEQGPRVSRIFNILTNEILELDADLAALDRMMQVLLAYRFRSTAPVTDEEFLRATEQPGMKVASVRDKLSFKSTEKVQGDILFAEDYKIFLADSPGDSPQGISVAPTAAAAPVRQVSGISEMDDTAELAQVASDDDSKNSQASVLTQPLSPTISRKTIFDELLLSSDDEDSHNAKKIAIPTSQGTGSIFIDLMQNSDDDCDTQALVGNPGGSAWAVNLLTSPERSVPMSCYPPKSRGKK